ncbi:MAG: CPBP family intramembrane metalloprotease [Lachnospiraceae bacterium]|nr:CPBP family intramembrane metalloprotease [Lachnospiraceae bacterium]
MEHYEYKPVRFYILVYLFTWGFWFLALLLKDTPFMFAAMILGLLSPGTIAVVTVMTSGNKMLKQDLKRKLVRFYRIKPLSILGAVAIYGGIVICSILTSVLFGGSIRQFSFTEDFSFSIAGTSALLTILLASVIEEVGWRGYGEDAVGSYNTWFKESIIFGCIWGCWHLPLFLIPGSYQNTLTELGPFYMINFLVCTIPMNFIQTWVYIKNNRSMLATIIFHLFINFMQEKIAMTPETKCIETIFVAVAAIILIVTNKKLFFGKEHIGRLLEVQNEYDNCAEKV